MLRIALAQWYVFDRLRLDSDFPACCRFCDIWQRRGSQKSKDQKIWGFLSSWSLYVFQAKEHNEFLECLLVKGEDNTTRSVEQVKEREMVVAYVRDRERELRKTKERIRKVGSDVCKRSNFFSNLRVCVCARGCKVDSADTTLFLSGKHSQLFLLYLALDNFEPTLDLFVDNKGDGLTRSDTEDTRRETLVESTEAFLLVNFRSDNGEALPCRASGHG